MAATAAVLNLLSAGDHAVVTDDLYGGTYRLFSRVLARYGLEFTYVDMTDLDAVRAAIRPNTKLFWIETPTNPLLKLVDIKARLRACASRGPDRRRRQHVCDAVFSAAARARRRRRRALDDEIHRRPQRRRRRRRDHQRPRLARRRSSFIKTPSAAFPARTTRG